MTTLADVLRSVRVAVVADACGLSRRAIYKWIDRGSLPRTEFTGETDYSSRIAKASRGQFSAAEIKRLGKQKLPYD